MKWFKSLFANDEQKEIKWGRIRFYSAKNLKTLNNVGHNYNGLAHREGCTLRDKKKRTTLSCTSYNQ